MWIGRLTECLAKDVAVAALDIQPVATAVIPFQFSFGPVALIPLSLDQGSTDSVSTVAQRRGLTFASSLHDSPDLIGVEVVPTIRFVGILSVTNPSSARLLADFGFSVEDLADPVNSAPLFPKLLPEVAHTTMCLPSLPFAGPQTSSYEDDLLGLVVSLPLFDVRQANGLRFVFDSDVRLDCIPINFNCSVTNTATWAAAIDVRLMPRDQPSKTVPEPCSLALLLSPAAAFSVRKGSR